MSNCLSFYCYQHLLKTFSSTEETVIIIINSSLTLIPYICVYVYVYVYVYHDYQKRYNCISILPMQTNTQLQSSSIAPWHWDRWGSTQKIECHVSDCAVVLDSVAVGQSRSNHVRISDGLDLFKSR